MKTESDLDGKWRGSHFDSCQRDKCANPKRNLINCFSCQRAFCSRCWQKVLKMPVGMKAAKGLQNCSIEPRTQTPPLPGHELIPEGLSAHASIHVTPIINTPPDLPTQNIPYFELSDSDDLSEWGFVDDCPSPADWGALSPSNIRPASKSQQTDLSFQPSKRPLDQSGEVLPNQNAKRLKSTSSISSIPTSNEESLERASSLQLQSGTFGHCQDGQNGGNTERKYISEGQYHTIQDLDVMNTMSGQREQESLAITPQALLTISDGSPRDTSNAGWARQAPQARGISEKGSCTENTGDTSVIDNGEFDRTRQDPNRRSEEGNATMQERYGLAPNERSPGVSQIRFDLGTNTRSPADHPDVAWGTAGQPTPQVEEASPPQGWAENSCPPTPRNPQLRSPPAQGPSGSHQDSVTPQTNSAGSSQQVDRPPQSQLVADAATTQPQNSNFISTSSRNCHQPPISQGRIQDFQSSAYSAPPANGQLQHDYPASAPRRPGMYGSSKSPGTSRDTNGEQRSLNQQTPQYQSPYHQHKISPVPLRSPHDPPPLSSPTPIQAGLYLELLTPSSFGAPHPPLQGASYLGGLQTPSQMPRPTQDASTPNLPMRGNCEPLFAKFKYASVDEVKNLPGDQKKIGEGWFSVFNPQVQRTLNITLLHTFSVESVVCCVRFSLDGRYLAVGCRNSAQIFDAFTGEKKYTLSIPSVDDPTKEIYVRSVCFSPDGKYLATASEDLLVRIWDIESRSIRHNFAGHKKEIYSLDFARDGRIIASGGADSALRLWDVEKGLPIVCLETEGTITSVALSPDSRFVAAGSLDNSARVWSISSGTVVENLEGSEAHTDAIYSVSFSPDGKYLVTGSLDKNVKMWQLRGPRPPSASEAKAGRYMQTLEGHKDFVLSVTTTPDGAWILSGSKDKGVQFWNPQTGVSHLRLEGHQNSVISVASSPLVSPERGGVFATGSVDQQAKIWSYSIVVPQQRLQCGISGCPPHIPNAEASPRTFHCHEQHATSGCQCSQLPPQSAFAPVSCQTVTQDQNASRNVPSKPQFTPTTNCPTSQNTSINKQDDPCNRNQPLIQCLLSPGNVAGIATHATQPKSAFEGERPCGQLKVDSQHALENTGSESIKKKPEEDEAFLLKLLNITRQFTLQAPQLLSKRLQELNCSQGSLPELEGAIQAHQEQLDKMKDEILQVEALYEGLLQHVSEEEKKDLVLSKERTVALKRQRSEGVSKEAEEKLRKLREDKADVEMLVQLVRDLKSTLPDVMKALHGLQAFVDTLPHV